MRRPTIRLYLLLAALVLAPASGANEPGPLTIDTLADGVYVFRPTDEAFDSWRSISNSGAVVLDDGVLIYDSHWTPELAEEAIRLLRRHTDLSVRYVVSSHFHGDHTGGYWAYGRDVEIISQHATRERLIADFPDVPQKLRTEIAQQETRIESSDDPVQRERTGNYLQANRNLLARIESDEPVPFPTLTFEESVVLHRGRTVEIHFLGRGHTDGDALLYLPEQKIAFLGDLLFTRTLPNVRDGHTKEWIETLEAVLGLGADRFLPGHGPLSDADDVREHIAYLRWLRSAVEPYVRDGKSVEDAQAGIELPERYTDYEFGFMVAPGIAKVFGELSEGR